ncbi:MAG TPA: HAD family phosphatase [Streptosporangiaceae bacterium]|nr:HAD family phosphatase [Streptosporangiaceae bacterium]
MTWVLFDYGGVICQPQPEQDVARLAQAAGCTVAELLTPYWAYRLAYDRAALDVTSYWQQVAADLGGTFSGPQIAELSRLDAGSWLHLQPATVDLVAGLAAAGWQLAVLSNAPDDTAQAVLGLPVAAHFEHLMFSCDLKLAKPDPDCFRAALAVLQAEPADVIFLDDRPDNVAAASTLGIRSAQFTGVTAARADLAGYGISVP